MRKPTAHSTLGISISAPFFLNHPKIAVALNTLYLATVALSLGFVAERVLMSLDIDFQKPEFLLYLAAGLLALIFDTIAKVLTTISALTMTEPVFETFEKIKDVELSEEQKSELEDSVLSLEVSSERQERGIAPLTKPLAILVVAVGHLLISSITTTQAADIIAEVPTLLANHPLTMGSVTVSILWSLRSPTNAKLLLGGGKAKTVILRIGKVITTIVFAIVPIMLIAAAAWLYFAQ